MVLWCFMVLLLRDCAKIVLVLRPADDAVVAELELAAKIKGDVVDCKTALLQLLHIRLDVVNFIIPRVALPADGVLQEHADHIFASLGARHLDGHDGLGARCLDEQCLDARCLGGGGGPGAGADHRDDANLPRLARLRLDIVIGVRRLDAVLVRVRLQCAHQPLVAEALVKLVLVRGVDCTRLRPLDQVLLVPYDCVALDAVR